MVNVYHPPTADDKVLEEHIMSGLDSVTKDHESVGIIITGDFNSFKRKALIQSSFHLKQIVTHPTRKKSILDLFFTNMWEWYTKVEILPPIGNSDHNTILVTPIFDPITVEPKFKLKRLQKHRNKVAFVRALNQENWTPLYDEILCKDKFLILDFKINRLMDEFLPWVKIKISAGTKPWVTDEFLDVLELRNDHWRRGNRFMFNYYRNKAEKIRRSLKVKFVSENMAKLNDPSEWWSGIKDIMGIKNKRDSLQHLVNAEFSDNAERFVNKANKFFVSVAQDIPSLNVDEIKELQEVVTVPDEYLPTVKDVERLLDNIKLRKSTGPDSVPNWIWRDCSTSLSSPIANIICASIRDSYWPDIWKSTDVIPLNKIPQPTTLETDIRPIGLTSVIGKAVGESLMVKYLWNFINGKINRNQFGAVKQGSTVTAMIKLLDNLLCAADKGNISRLVMIDFSKAFERIDHGLLLRKLLDMDVPIWLVKWIASFLSDRMQRVKYKGVFSEWLSISTGVPQGTKLGPIGFIVMINDLLADMMYVDDSSLVESVKNPEDSQLNDRVNDLVEWANKNKMKLNGKKTMEIRISFRKKVPIWTPITINSEVIQSVQSAKLLGFVINDKLNWDDHLKMIFNKCNQRMYFIGCMMRAGFKNVEIVAFFCASIRSILEYGAPVWHNAITQKQSNEIEAYQRRLIKLIEKIHPQNHNYPYENLLEKYDLYTLYNRRENLCRRLFNNICDPNHPLHDCLTVNKKHHSMDLRNTKVFCAPRCLTNRYKNSFIPSAINNFM